MRDDICFHCGEGVDDGDRHTAFAEPIHCACAIRLVVGSVAHVERRCGCYVPGSTLGDPPGLTIREAARLAMMAYDVSQRTN